MVIFVVRRVRPQSYIKKIQRAVPARRYWPTYAGHLRPYKCRGHFGPNITIERLANAGHFLVVIQIPNAFGVKYQFDSKAISGYLRPYKCRGRVGPKIVIERLAGAVRL